MIVKQFGIRKKLVLAFVSVALLVTLVAFLAMWLSFQTGFLRYINDSRYESLQNTVLKMNEHLTSHKQWQQITQSPRTWRRFLEGSLADDNIKSLQHEGERQRRPEKRYILLDVNKKMLFGPSGLDVKLLAVEITIDQDVVGFLALPALDHLNEQIDKKFVVKQQQYFVVIALIAIILATVFAYFLSHWMVSPLQRIVVAMNSLKQRDYSDKIEYKSNDELGHLVETFNQLTQALHKHEQTQKQWIADISHELRTPLTTLRGEIEAIQDGIRRLEPSAIESLHEELMRLQRIVEDLHQLSLADLGAFRYHFSLVSLHDIITKLIHQQNNELVRHKANVNIKIVGDEQPMYCDADRLYQLFQNALQNSLRYSYSPSTINITLDFNRVSWVTVLWEDSAPSVMSLSLSKLFERLYREERSRNRQQGGSGLGLSICKAIVEAHQGTISADHSALGGLKISMTLPLESGV